MSFIDRLRERLFGYRDVEPEGMDAIRGLQRKNEVAAPEENVAAPAAVNEAQNGQGSESAAVEATGPKAFPERVLFVCSGNMCRSPYGAARFSQLVKRDGVQVMSAGTLKLNGRPAAEGMVAAAAENGLDLSTHRSTALSRSLLLASDVVFVMENVHRTIVLNMCPEAESRIVMLGQFLPEPQPELEDPMGKEPEVYARVAREIDTALENWLKQFD